MEWGRWLMIEDAKVDGKIASLYASNAPPRTCNNGKPGCKVARNSLLVCFAKRVVRATTTSYLVLGGDRVPGYFPVEIGSALLPDILGFKIH
jgi:hypothetical protein